MFPEDLALFQYYKGLVFGVVIGIGFAWLMWRLPVHVRTRHVRKLRAMVLDMKRIEAALHWEWRPNPRELRVLRVPLRDRVRENIQVWWYEWCNNTAPRTPEEIAGRHPSWQGTS